VRPNVQNDGIIEEGGQVGQQLVVLLAVGALEFGTIVQNASESLVIDGAKDILFRKGVLHSNC